MLTLQAPFTYEALLPEKINFVPLKQKKSFSAKELMQVLMLTVCLNSVGLAGSYILTILSGVLAHHCLSSKWQWMQLLRHSVRLQQGPPLLPQLHHASLGSKAAVAFNETQGTSRGTHKFAAYVHAQHARCAHGLQTCVSAVLSGQ